MPHPTNEARRYFLKTVAAGAVAGSTQLVYAEGSKASTINLHWPDIAKGEVLRTAGSVEAKGKQLN